MAGVTGIFERISFLLQKSLFVFHGHRFSFCGIYTELGNRPNNHQLYYLVSDPGEKSNVYKDNKEKAEQLRAKLISEIERGAHYKGLKELKVNQ